uniref:Uncharacterized protein n=1 Tax=Anguilla anguilla TaxID=7936 RepID=A0A0E9X910_ANGAN
MRLIQERTYLRKGHVRLQQREMSRRERPARKRRKVYHRPTNKMAGEIHPRAIRKARVKAKKTVACLSPTSLILLRSLIL